MNLTDLTLDYAKRLDDNDALAKFRDKFAIPQHNGQSEIYFVGNSLGLMPKHTIQFVNQELEQWRSLGVRGHFEGDFPWMPYHELLTAEVAQIAGAQTSEVVMMNGLTVNLHLLMATFYRPQRARTKIMIEQHAFPSDSYAVASRLNLSGFDPEEHTIVLQPDQGELFSADHVCQTIQQHADSLALIILPGVQYYTGQVFDMKRIAATAKAHGIVIGFDLAHAVGNIELQLHDWDVDFAVWCSYKYLNSGPGAVAGCFIHQRHASNTDLPRMGGWWGQDKATRFQMGDQFTPIATAEGWQLSNPPILALAPIRAALELFTTSGGMPTLRKKSIKLTGYFANLLEQRLSGHVSVITPQDPQQRGCQLSLEISSEDGRVVYHRLEQSGVRTDWREPNVIRAAPVPLYNSFEDVWHFVDRLADQLTGG